MFSPAARKPVVGLEMVRDAYVFQSGTTLKNERIVTSGGRVMSVTGMGKDLESAINSAYRSVNLIAFDGKYVRSDIGHDLVKQPAVKAGAAQQA